MDMMIPAFWPMQLSLSGLGIRHRFHHCGALYKSNLVYIVFIPPLFQRGVEEDVTTGTLQQMVGGKHACYQIMLRNGYSILLPAWARIACSGVLWFGCNGVSKVHLSHMFI